MFSATKAQFDLALAWSELAMSTFTATTMIANSGAKVLAASTAFEQAGRSANNSPPAFVNPWAGALTQGGMIDPMRFAFAATQASTAFWCALLEPPKPAAKPHPLWWTVFTDPLVAKTVAAPAPRDYLLH
jgi:hypothetical protein